MNFIICYTPRSGGNIVMDFLNHQTNLHCHGNIFPYDDKIILNDPATLATISIDFKKLMENLKWPACVRKLKEAQNLTNLLLKEKNRYDNVATILKILGKTESKAKVGFKFSLEDYEKAPAATKVKLFKQCSKENIKIVFLDRRNQFEQYVSLQLCDRSKKYERITTELPKLQKIGIKPTEYLAFKQHSDLIKNKFIQDLIKFNVDFREYYYEDLKEEETYKDSYVNMLEFIGEPIDAYIDAYNLIKFKKVNIYPPNISVSNYSSVSQFLKAKNDANFI